MLFLEFGFATDGSVGRWRAYAVCASATLGSSAKAKVKKGRIMISRIAGVASVCVAGFMFVGVASAGSHTWDITEVFSNASGTIQFIELQECCGNMNEVGLPGHDIISTANTFTIPGGPLAPSTANKFYLIATQGFADLPGAPTPDAIIPSGSVPFFSTAGDTVQYDPWDTWVFGAVPTDGTTSLERDGTMGPNSPTNYAGDTGSVDAGAPVPTVSAWGFTVLGLAVLIAGAVVFARGRIGARLA